MPFASIVFWAVFVVPLVIFLVWLMRQDKKKGITGLVVMAVLIIVAVAYMYLMTHGE
ncbi:MAG: hypothetical protein ABIN91_00355 [Mucilaginibacter sp.]|uniref:hypothetical protein n=1 Tax=Mucilaginibacter sp. TaxID=1882438 RepID=UPI0032670536